MSHSVHRLRYLTRTSVGHQELQPPMFQINNAHCTTVRAAAAVVFYAALRARGQCLPEINVTCHGGVRIWLYVARDHQQNAAYGKWLGTDIT